MQMKKVKKEFIRKIGILIITIFLLIGISGGNSILLQKRFTNQIEKSNYLKAAKPNYSYSNPKVPRGFTHTEGEWNNGFIIKDETGNEFVWVPVDGTNVKYEEKYLTGWGGIPAEEISTDILESVSLFGGFYVGRYEAALESAQQSQAEFMANMSNPDFDPYPYFNVTNVVSAPISKSGYLPWFNLTWEKAEASAKIMYNEETSGVKSRLMNDVAWDTMLNWLIYSGAKTVADIEDSSTSWGNYWDSEFDIIQDGSTYHKTSGEMTLITTGSVSSFVANKIYDLAGNINEYTTRALTVEAGSGHIYRGGAFNAVGTDIPADESIGQEEIKGFQSYNYNLQETDGIAINVGFRTALYLVDEPYIPQGFHYVEGSVDTGFVIADNTDNQFVWIPIVNDVKLERKDWTTGDVLIKDLKETLDTGLTTSVTSEKGFYIGRYEASEAGISKTGNIPKTNISQTDAITACTAYNSISSEISTHLIYGSEWDAALQFMNKDSTDFATVATYGNYSKIIANTGATATDKKKNIFDMSGNVREWTQETRIDDTNFAAFRGGYYNYAFPAGYRNSDIKSTTDKYIGYRVAFYIK